MKTLGIDIGGTKIEYIVINFNPFRIVDHQRYKTPKNRRAFLKLINDIIKNSIRDFNIASAGIGMPGYVIKNRIYNTPNIPFLEGYEIRYIKRNHEISIFIENDANLFTYGEALIGSGRKYNPVFGVTLGTGIGGGIVINKKIYKGFFNNAGEIGHTIIKANGKICVCGKRGCLESYAGGKAILNEFHKKKGKIEEIIKTKTGREIIKKAVDYISIGLSNVVNILSPEVIVLGGGISNIKDIDKLIEKNIKKYLVRGIDIKIKKAALGNSSGAIGASLFAKHCITHCPFLELE